MKTRTTMMKRKRVKTAMSDLKCTSCIFSFVIDLLVIYTFLIIFSFMYNIFLCCLSATSSRLESCPPSLVYMSSSVF